MSEYARAHTVSGFIGARPGYVGFDRGGLLTDAVSTTPPRCSSSTRSRRRTIPDVFNVLLEGWTTAPSPKHASPTVPPRNHNHDEQRRCAGAARHGWVRQRGKAGEDDKAFRTFRPPSSEPARRARAVRALDRRVMKSIVSKSFARSRSSSCEAGELAADRPRLEYLARRATTPLRRASSTAGPGRGQRPLQHRAALRQSWEQAVRRVDSDGEKLIFVSDRLVTVDAAGGPRAGPIRHSHSR